MHSSALTSPAGRYSRGRARPRCAASTASCATRWPSARDNPIRGSVGGGSAAGARRRSVTARGLKVGAPHRLLPLRAPFMCRRNGLLSCSAAAPAPHVTTECSSEPLALNSRLLARTSSPGSSTLAAPIWYASRWCAGIGDQNGTGATQNPFSPHSTQAFRRSRMREAVIDASCIAFYAAAWVLHSLVVSVAAESITTRTRAALLTVVELVKLLLMLLVLAGREMWRVWQGEPAKQGRGRRWNPCDPQDLAFALQYAVPAVVYAFVNVLAFLALKHIDPATYKVLINVRVLFTGLISRVLLSKKLTAVQWQALALLFFSCSLAAPADLNLSKFASSFVGVAVVLAQAALSATGGVVFQFLAQGRVASASGLALDKIQSNAVLYGFGAAVQFVILSYVLASEGESFGFASAFAFSKLQYFAILMFVVAGLGTAVILTRLGAITKEFAHSIEMLVTPFAQWYVLHTPAPSLRLLFAVVLVAAALFMYNGSRAAEETPEQSKAGGDRAPLARECGAEERAQPEPVVEMPARSEAGRQ